MSDIDNDNTINNDTINNDKDNPAGSIGAENTDANHSWADQVKNPPHTDNTDTEVTCTVDPVAYFMAGHAMTIQHHQDTWETVATNTRGLDIIGPPDSPKKEHPCFTECVKTGVLRLLSAAVQYYKEKKCYGCYTAHPSQIHHPCLWPIPEDFYTEHYEELMYTLWTDDFIPTVQMYVSLYGIETTADRINGAAAMICHNLLTVDNVPLALVSYDDPMPSEYEPPGYNWALRLERLCDGWQKSVHRPPYNR
ncbi:uncharacterized protein LOC130196109 [Pseudoliparis swirei]|uniref:uncharacterized protein LOC130196109 n=1 Tax=Pseudoliparis swirei TaxID=2059687 RepID=UPI0024BD5DB2|nr:uncharacterized protein LOC130196109 [Pseudoliparis swirei]